MGKKGWICCQRGSIVQQMSREAVEPPYVEVLKSFMDETVSHLF